MVKMLLLRLLAAATIIRRRYCFRGVKSVDSVYSVGSVEVRVKS